MKKEIIKRYLYRKGFYYRRGYQYQRGIMEEKEFMQKIEEIRKHLQEHLKKERYEHSLSVAFTSICLAMAHGVDILLA